MKVCDRHPRTPAADEVSLKATDSTYDLCQACSDQILAFLGDFSQETVEVKPKTPRKRKFLDFRAETGS